MAIPDLTNHETQRALIYEFFKDRKQTLEKYKNYPEIIQFLQSNTELLKEMSGKRRDPQESDPILGPIIQAAGNLASQTIENGIPRRGRCNLVWIEQKRLLAEQGIDWQSPAEMNPYIRFS